MARKWLIIGLLLFLPLFMWTTASTASEITLTSSYDLTLQIQPTGSSATLPDSGTIRNDLDGMGLYNPNETIFVYTMASAPGSVASSIYGGTWVKNATATATATDRGTLNFSTNLQGWGPQPENPGDPSSTGFISQNSVNRYDWSFTAPTAGTFDFSMIFSCDIDFQMHQGAGSGYPMTNLSVLSQVSHEVNYSGGSLELFEDLINESFDFFPNPLFDYCFIGVHWESVEIAIFGISLQEGETMSGEIIIRDGYSGRSLVPLPSSLFLLGSGLVGVLALRRRPQGKS